jgi:hypothetical protein
MLKLATILIILSIATAFVPAAFTRSTNLSLKMSTECPEIPITAQLDPKFDTAIIALG